MVASSESREVQHAQRHAKPGHEVLFEHIHSLHETVPALQALSGTQHLFASKTAGTMNDVHAPVEESPSVDVEKHGADRNEVQVEDL